MRERWSPHHRPAVLRGFRIRDKLNILLLLALAAVLLVAVPFVAGQIGNARSAARTADAARDTQALSGLIWELQRERLATAAYLAGPTLDATELRRQQARVDSAAEGVRVAVGADASDELASALVRLGSLQEPRQSALARGISPDRVARTYHAVTEALVDALRLVPQDTGDAEGTRQLAALDALLRADEFNAVREMSLIAAAVNPQTGLVLLSDASAQAPLYIEQFVQQADAGASALVVQVDQGDAARRIDALTTELTGPSGRPAASFITDALPLAQTQLTARRAVQDQVISRIAEAATSRASDARQVALLVGIGAALLFGLVAALAIAVSRSIARPLQRLTSAATDVADLAGTELARVTTGEASDEQVPHLPPIQVTTADEVGELAAAFNRVQATATDLVQQHAIRRNNDVSVMFANVAQRTQNLVGRQLALIDELERNEQDGRLLAHLYRLDHLSTRLRRTADDLLVIADSPADGRIQGPVALTTALRSAVAEIEDYQRVELDDLGEVVLGASLGSDAVLMFAELLDNAASFSPPHSAVEVSTEYPNDGSCVVRIVDHGIGMGAERLTEENTRLAERERAHLAPSGVLGLFVVGRLARRHSLTVRLFETPGGGVTVCVGIPADLYSRASAPRMESAGNGSRPTAPAPSAVPAEQGAPATQATPAQQTPARGVLSLPELVIPPARHTDGFTWFPDSDPHVPTTPAAPSIPATPAAPGAAPPPGAQPASHGGLTRRVPGARLADGTVASRAAEPDGRPRHDAAAARDVLNGYQSGVASAVDGRRPVAPPPPHEASGLSRRVPGASLAPGLRGDGAPARPAPVVAGVPQRNPDADLAAFDAFSAGFAQADLATADLPRGDLAVTPHGVSGPEPSHRIPVRPTPRAGSAEPTHGRNE